MPRQVTRLQESFAFDAALAYRTLKTAISFRPSTCCFGFAACLGIRRPFNSIGKPLALPGDSRRLTIPSRVKKVSFR
jgi:hypothetical protein